MSGSMGVGSRFVLPLQQINDPAGIPYVGAKAYFYSTGTSTFQNTYADVDLSVPNTNPVITNSAGFWPNIFMMLAPAYRVRVTDANDAVLFDCDPVGPAAGSAIGTVPIGGIIAFAGTSPPTGYILCDGSAVSRTAFSGLFSTIGTTFGSGDGATTFNVPDLRGRFIGGLDTMGGVAANRLTAGNSGVDGATMGASGGDELMQLHNHTVTDPMHYHADAGHAHYTDAVASQTLGDGVAEINYFAGGWKFDHLATIGTGYAAIQYAFSGVTVDNAGTGGSQNIPPALVLGYCIFAG